MRCLVLLISLFAGVVSANTEQQLQQLSEIQASPAPPGPSHVEHQQITADLVLSKNEYQWIATNAAGIIPAKLQDENGTASGVPLHIQYKQVTADPPKTEDPVHKNRITTAAAPPKEHLSPTTKLALVLFKIMCTILLGAASNTFHMVVPGQGHMNGIQFIVGRVALPLLIFNTVATADLWSIDLNVIAACSLGKLCVLVGTWFLCFCLYQSGRSKGQRFLTATVFGLYATSSNDFAIGFPVIGAMYGPAMEIYLGANATVQAAFFQPLAMVMLAIGKSMKASQDSEAGAAVGNGNGGGSNGCVRVAKEVLLNPVIGATIAGLAINMGLGITSLPHPFCDVIDAFTQPFGTLALFMTGMSLKSPSLNTWVCLLVIMKVFICAYLSYVFALVCGKTSDELQDFSFFYGSIPTGSAPLVFAQIFDESSVDTVATAILLGIFCAAPNMILTSMFMAEPGDMIDALASTIITIGWISFLAGIIFILLLCVTAKHWAGLKEGIAVYGVVAFLYTLCLLGLNVLEWPCQAVMAGANDFWCPYRLAFNTLQKACVLSLFYLRYRAPLSGIVDWERGFGSSVIKELAVVALAVIPGVFTQPFTLSKVCKLEPNPNNSYSYFIISIVCFSLVVFMAIQDMRRSVPPPASGNPDAIQMSSNAEQEEAAFDAAATIADTPDGHSHSRSGAFTIRTLFRLMGLRFLLQMVTSGSLSFGLSVRGSLTQMIIIECLFEHGQMLFLLLTLLFDPSFKNKIIIATAFRNKTHSVLEHFHAHHHSH